MKILKTISIAMAIIIGFVVLYIGNINYSKNNNAIIIYCASEQERVDWLQAKLEKKFPNYNIIFQVLGTGEMVTKLQGEGKNTDCDIVFDLESCNAQMINAQNDIFADLSDYDFSIFEDDVITFTTGETGHKNFLPESKYSSAVIVNKKILEKHGLSIPTTYEDLLDSRYKNLIKMPSPKSSGTGYSFYCGAVSSMGEENALDYFDALEKNIKEFTTSGSTPTKSVARGETAVGIGILWQALEYAKENDDLEVVFLNGESAYNLYMMAMIDGKQKRKSVREVFDFIYQEANMGLVLETVPGKIYKNQPPAKVENWPTDFVDIQMQGIFDYKFKQSLLDKWKF